jgi:septum formation inhibitor MinC
MESAALNAEPVIADAPPAAVLRGTARGLEVVVDSTAALADITAAMVRRLVEAPGFFKGSDLRVRFDHGKLPAGYLAQLDELAVSYDLRIVEVTPAKPDKEPKAKTPTLSVTAGDADAVPVMGLAAGSAPSPAFEDEAPTNSNAQITRLPAPTDLAEPVMLADSDLELAETEDLPGPDTVGTAETFDEPTQTVAPVQLAASPELPQRNDPGTRVVMGPVRSGVILEHFGHLIIFGDINPGAEVRASGNIVVLGRLRGTAHAGIGQDVGFILALRLEPQQLRIGRQVARAADSDTPASEPELAYGTGDSIIVERYQGKLPRNLATSI